MDLFLADVMVAGLLADVDALGIAAGEIENGIADEAIVQDHVGFVQHAQRAQRQQSRIARAGTDQRHRANGPRALSQQRAIEFLLRFLRVMRADGDRIAFDHTCAERAACRKVAKARANAVARTIEQFRQWTQGVIEKCFGRRAASVPTPSAPPEEIAICSGARSITAGTWNGKLRVVDHR